MKKFFLTVLLLSFLTTFILAGESSTDEKVFVEKLSADEEDLLRNFRALSLKDQKKFKEKIKKSALRNKRQEVKEKEGHEFPLGDLLFFGM